MKIKQQYSKNELGKFVRVFLQNANLSEPQKIMISGLMNQMIEGMDDKQFNELLSVMKQVAKRDLKQDANIFD